MGATIFCCAKHETLFDLAGQWMKQQIKKKWATCPPLFIAVYPAIQDLLLLIITCKETKKRWKYKLSGTKKSIRLPTPHTCAPTTVCCSASLCGYFLSIDFQPGYARARWRMSHYYCLVSPVPGKNSNQHLRCYSTKRVYIWGEYPS